jgi:hypothetical protein
VPQRGSSSIPCIWGNICLHTASDTPVPDAGAVSVVAYWYPSPEKHFRSRQLILFSLGSWYCYITHCLSLKRTSAHKNKMLCKVTSVSLRVCSGMLHVSSSDLPRDPCPALLETGRCSPLLRYSAWRHVLREWGGMFVCLKFTARDLIEVSAFLNTQNDFEKL